MMMAMSLGLSFPIWPVHTQKVSKCIETLLVDTLARWTGRDFAGHLWACLSREGRQCGQAGGSWMLEGLG